MSVSPFPGVQVRPNVMIIDDSVFIVLAYDGDSVLSLSAPAPTQLLRTPMNDDAWRIITRDAEYVLTPEDT